MGYGLASFKIMRREFWVLNIILISILLPVDPSVNSCPDISFYFDKVIQVEFILIDFFEELYQELFVELSSLKVKFIFLKFLLFK